MPNIAYNNIPFDERDLNDPTTNFTLGQFMTAWSQVESLCGFLFRELSQIDAEIATIIFDRVGTREQIEIVSELLANFDDSAVDCSAASAMEEVDSLSKARNKIVHAGWGLLDGEPARFWHGITSQRMIDIASATPKGVADRKRYIFTLSDVLGLTERCVKVREHLECLLSEAWRQRLEKLHERDARLRPFHQGTGREHQ